MYESNFGTNRVAQVVTAQYTETCNLVCTDPLAITLIGHQKLGHPDLVS